MLLKFRNFAQSKFIKVLMVLLLLTFALWGVGDMLRAGSHSDVATYSGGELRVEDWMRAYSSYVSNQGEATELQAYEAAVDIANSLVKYRLFKLEAERLGFAISDDMIKYNLAFSPEFQKEGVFSKENFEKFLAARNLTEQNFIEYSRDTLAQNFLVQMFESDFILSPIVLDEAYKDEVRKRNFNVVCIKPENIAKTATFTDEELRDHYEKNKVRFLIPEVREVSYALITSDNIKINTNINDKEINEFINEQQSVLSGVSEESKQKIDFTKHARDSILNERKEQALKNLYQQIDQDIRAGYSFTSILDKYNLKAKNTSIKKGSDGLNSEIVKQAFETDLDKVSPITPLGLDEYVVLTVKGITEASHPPFAKIKEQIIKLANEYFIKSAAQNLAEKFSTKVKNNEELLNLAQEHGLKVKQMHMIGKYHETDTSDLSIANLLRSKEDFIKVLSLRLGEVYGPMEVENGSCFVSLLKVEEGNVAKLTDDSKKSIKEMLAKVKQVELYNQYVKHLYDQYNVKINAELLAEIIEHRQ